MNTKQLLMNAHRFFKIAPVIAAVLLLANCTGKMESASTDSSDSGRDKIEILKIENLLRDSLGLADGVEIIVSYLEMPDSTTLPPHYHPGEEFVYMLEGSGELTLNDQPPVTVSEGELVKIPLRQIHSFSTINDQSRAIVFRVHEEGQPDRILVE